MNRHAPLWVKYTLTGALGLLASGGVLATHGFSLSAAPAERWRLLCDAFFVPAVLLLGAAALIFISNRGGFNGVGYAARYAVRMFVPWSGKRDESFGEFVARREKEGGVRGYAFLLHVGLAFLAAAVVFLVLFTRCETI